MPVTLSDIAKKVGVTKQTVSLVLNKQPSQVSISEKTREKVMKAARDLNYQPNYLARNLKEQKSYYIGVTYPEGLLYSENPYLSRLQYGLALAMVDSDYGLVFQNKPMDVDHAVKLTHSKRFDGVIFVLYGHALKNFKEQAIPVLNKNRVPFVLVHSTSQFQLPCHNVGFDNFKAGYLAAEHLIKLGHKDIGYMGVGSGDPNTLTVAEMKDGFCQAITDNGLDPDPDRVMYLSGHLQGYDKLLPFFKEHKPRSAYVGFDDYLVSHITRSLQENGYTVPGDVALVSGHSEITRLQSNWLARPRTITSVKETVIDKGTAAARMLLNVLAEPEKHTEPERIIFEPELVVRQSCGAGQ